MTVALLAGLYGLIIMPQNSYASNATSSMNSTKPRKALNRAPGKTRPVRAVLANSPENNLIALLDAASALSRRDEIAYVWGGRATSSPVVCSACQRCVEKRKVHPHQRLSKCPACEQCGVDCSGFVSRVMGAAGLGSKRITSRSLIKAATPGPKRGNLKGAKKVDPVFIPVGRNLALAQPGDLVVLSDHVVIFLNRHPNKKLDYVHASRYVPGRPAGGIEVVSAGDLPRGQVPVTILRHKAFAGTGNSLAVRKRITAMLEHAQLKKKARSPVLPSRPVAPRPSNVHLARAH